MNKDDNDALVNYYKSLEIYTKLLKRCWQFLVVACILGLSAIAFDLIVDILNRIF
jgi:hypothetical protein